MTSRGENPFMTAAQPSPPQCRRDDQDVRHALRFFWGWLLVSSGVSIAGNAAHAVMNAEAGTAVVAAAVAVVPPAVLLAATHGVAMLVKLGRTSASLAAAVFLTLGLGVIAFILSFDALASLALVADIRPSRAWMWPAAVDGGITLATVAIFGLSRLAARDEQVLHRDGHPATAAAPGTAPRASKDRATASPLNPSELAAERSEADLTGPTPRTETRIDRRRNGESVSGTRAPRTAASRDTSSTKRSPAADQSIAEPASSSYGNDLIRIGATRTRRQLATTPV